MSGTIGRAKAPGLGKVWAVDFDPPGFSFNEVVLPQCNLGPTPEKVLDHHWANLPREAKDFILRALDGDGFLTLQELVDFWTSPRHFEHASSNIARIMWSSLYLALVHFRRKNLKDATALMLNGVFFHECHHSSMEHVRDVCRSDSAAEELQCWKLALETAHYPQGMDSFLQCFLPKEYMELLTPHFDSSQRGHVMKRYINQVSDSWREGPTAGKGAKSKMRSPQSLGKGAPITLIFEDDANEEVRHSFDIESSSVLKSLFNEYAEKRVISPRSLRFSCEGRTLFISTDGRKTPEQLGLHDQSVVKVHDTSASREPLRDEVATASKTGNNKKKKCAKKSKRQCKNKRKEVKHVVVEKTGEELKIEHSNMLDKLYAELQPRLEQIRQRLNNLAIERSQPKTRSKRRNTKKVANDLLMLQSMVDNQCTQGLGGKAGKSRFTVHVGEVENLYKSTKSPALSPRSHRSMPKLDLHGLTREDAVTKLDKSLEEWVHTAMLGSYPFVMQAEIVCGCGNQILRETVHEWIKTKKSISNAPKNR